MMLHITAVSLQPGVVPMDAACSVVKPHNVHGSLQQLLKQAICADLVTVLCLSLQMAGQSQQPLLPNGFPGSAPMNGMGGLPGGLGAGGLPAGLAAPPSTFNSVEAQAAYQAAYQVNMLSAIGHSG